MQRQISCFYTRIGGVVRISRPHGERNNQIEFIKQSFVKIKRFPIKTMKRIHILFEREIDFNKKLLRHIHHRV